MMKNTVTISVTIPVNVMAVVEAYASKYHVSRNSVINKWLCNGLPALEFGKLFVDDVYRGMFDNLFNGD